MLHIKKDLLHLLLLGPFQGGLIEFIGLHMGQGTGVGVCWWLVVGCWLCAAARCLIGLGAAQGGKEMGVEGVWGVSM